MLKNTIKCILKKWNTEGKAGYEWLGGFMRRHTDLSLRTPKGTSISRGITYIQFSKTSEAALAMEEMNGTCLGDFPRPLKVMIAHNRDEGSKRDPNEEERLLRLFCVVPKTLTDEMLREHFEQFGDIDYVSVVKDRETKESKGFAYVKYHRVSHAAKAFENCDRLYKAVFAEPKRPKPSYDRMDTSFMDNRFTSPPQSNISFDQSFSPFNSKNNYPSGGESTNTLRIIASSDLNQDQLWKLFDLVPGLDYLTLDSKARGKGQAVAVYNSPGAAGYAREKLHGFEYPPGQRLIVKTDQGSLNDSGMALGVRNMMTPMRNDGYIAPSPPRMQTNMQTNMGPQSNTGRPGGLQTDLATLAETIAQATSLIQAAGLTPNIGGSGGNAQQRDGFDPSYCSIKLPPPQPLAPMEANAEERLFIVCHPGPPPMYALRDVFGRFGNLIDVYMLNGKNCGYAKYANKESAETAIGRTFLTVMKKYEIIQEVDEKKITKTEFARQHSIPKSTLFTILKMRKDIVNALQKEGHNVKSKNLKGAMHANLEQVMLKWFSQHRAQNVPINGPIRSMLRLVNEEAAVCVLPTTASPEDSNDPLPVDANSQPGPSMELQFGPSTAPLFVPLTFTRPCGEETWQRLAPDCMYEDYIAAHDITSLHGAEICGNRLKVMAADPRHDDRRKRIRMDDQ
uniref:RRM domain-containing protein n=1 Tax=Timema shepardi TaxID=629360 RepID=A0A7R9G516_TIMSH|nr:unnamed protein product [Timema shepardi]